MVINKILNGGKIMNKAYFSVAAILMCIFFCGCESIQQTLMPEKPSAQIKNIKFGDADSSAATLIFDIEVYNPYPVDLPLTNLKYNITSGQSGLLSGDAPLASMITAKDRTTVSLPVKMNYAEAFNALKGIKPGATIDYKADATLTTTSSILGKFDIPLKKEGQMAVPELTGSSIMNILNKIPTK